MSPVQPEKDLHTQKDMYTELLAFFNAVNEVFVSYDFVGHKVVRISNACEKLFGYTAAELLANNYLWLALVYPADRYIAINEYKALQHGEHVNSQHRIIRKDGSVSWVEKKIAPVLENGKLIRFDGVIRDITDRKEEEERCRNSEEMYRQIVETAQEGIWTIDKNGIINFVNKKIAEILGYEPHEMLGKLLFDFMDEENAAKAADRIQRISKGGKENANIKYRTKKGDNVWANISTNPVFDKAGNFNGALAMVTDITNKRADEEAIKESEANLRTIFNNTDSSYILINAERRIVSFNALAQKYSEENNNRKLLVNAHIQDYFPADRWAFIQQTLEEVAVKGTANYELNFTDKNGTVKWHDVRWLNVKDADGKNRGFILANMDITGTKNAALEKEKITAELIQHNNHLEQFTYIVSHNLRAPVANIIGLSDLLKEHDLEPDMRLEVVDKISSSITNIDVIIQDLNHILQARKPVNEKKETVYFNQLVNVIKTGVYNSLANKNVQINCSFDEVDGIFAIRSYLYSIFYNLVSNAIKYCKPGLVPVITISSHKFDNKVVLIFKDNGKGIDLEKNGGQLFGLYKRFDTAIEGKGMGLFMVKTQVEALGGTISINSKLGEGTAFTIQFTI